MSLTINIDIFLPRGMIVKLNFKAIKQYLYKAIQNMSDPTNWSKSGI